MAKFCPKCGNRIDADAKFCNYCGSQLTINQTQEAPPVQHVDFPSSYTPYQPSPELVIPKTTSTVRYADFWELLVAFIIDMIIISIIGWLISFPFNYSGWYWWPRFFLDWGIGFLYFWGLETINHGQTLGKAALQIRTVDETTFQPPNVGRHVINNLLKPSWFLLLDLIIGLLANSNEPVDRKRYRYMQNASKTVVIKTR